MTQPFFLPDELEYCEGLGTSELLLTHLKAKSVDHVILYFEAGAKDHTWTKREGLSILADFLHWFRFAFLQREIELEQMRRVLQAVRENIVSLRHAISEDLEVATRGTSFTVNLFLFAASSSYFAKLVAAGPKKIELPVIDTTLAASLKEFIYCGQIENLWKQEPEDIYQLIQKSASLYMLDLEAFASQIFERYLDADSIGKYFEESVRKKLFGLTKACCRWMSRSPWGFTVEPLAQGTLAISLVRWHEDAQQMLVRLAPLVKELRWVAGAAADARFISFITRLQRLNALILHDCDPIDPILLESLPDVLELFLEKLFWLTDALFLQMIQKMHSLQAIHLQHNRAISFRSFGALGLLPSLTTLALDYNEDISDDDIELIAISAQHLKILRLSHCPSLTDRGIGRLARSAPLLQEIDLSFCPHITESGLIDLVFHAAGIQQVVIQGSKAVTANVHDQVRRHLPHIRIKA